MTDAPNILYYGDNLDILRRYVADESVDLVYLDPPFNSNATYNVLFAEHHGEQAASQIKAFEDTWTWDLSAEWSYKNTVEARFYDSPWGGSYPRIQILTVAQLLAGERIDYPNVEGMDRTFKKAPKAAKSAAPHPKLPLGE